MNNTDARCSVFQLTGNRRGQQLTLDEASRHLPKDGLLWVNLDYTLDSSLDWLKQQSYLSEVVVEILTSEDPRPRSFVADDALVVVMRGVNMNPGADPEDMVSIRMFINDHLVITTNRRRLRSVDEMVDAINNNKGPQSSGRFLSLMADMLIDRMAAVVDDIEDQVDDLQDKVLTIESHELRPQLSDLRRQMISLRRYLAPQRDAMTRLYNEKVDWLDEPDRMRLREVNDMLMRYIEDLDSARERAAVTQEELVSRLSEQMDRRMYTLSVIAALFLPLSFLTGLFGINVGGIPGSEFKWAFIISCVALLAIAVAQILAFRKLKWI